MFAGGDAKAHIKKQLVGTRRSVFQFTYDDG
jgi:hypothetical protein